MDTNKQQIDSVDSIKPQPSYYAVIPAFIRYDKNIIPNAKLLYGEITALCNKEGFCWAANSYFADLYACSEKTISFWLSNLREKGYITIEISRSENKRRIGLGDAELIKKISSRPDNENVITWLRKGYQVGENDSPKSQRPSASTASDSSLNITINKRPLKDRSINTTSGQEGHSDSPKNLRGDDRLINNDQTEKPSIHSPVSKKRSHKPNIAPKAETDNPTHEQTPEAVISQTSAAPESPKSADLAPDTPDSPQGVLGQNQSTHTDAPQKSLPGRTCLAGGIPEKEIKLDFRPNIRYSSNSIYNYFLITAGIRSIRDPNSEEVKLLRLWKEASIPEEVIKHGIDLAFRRFAEAKTNGKKPIYDKIQTLTYCEVPVAEAMEMFRTGVLQSEDPELRKRQNQELFNKLWASFDVWKKQACVKYGHVSAEGVPTEKFLDLIGQTYGQGRNVGT